MGETLQQHEVLSALERLRTADIDRLRLKLWRLLEKQLHRIPDAPDPDELLLEAIDDLITMRRECPKTVNMVTCLFQIVRSKASHRYAKSKKEMIVKVSDEILDFIPVPEIPESDLYDRILELVADDQFVTQIVHYQLQCLTDSDKLSKAQELAQVFGVNIEAIYNANRRLKTRLEVLTETPCNREDDDQRRESLCHEQHKSVTTAPLPG